MNGAPVWQMSASHWLNYFMEEKKSSITYSLLSVSINSWILNHHFCPCYIYVGTDLGHRLLPNKEITSFKHIVDKILVDSFCFYVIQTKKRKLSLFLQKPSSCNSNLIREISHIWRSIFGPNCPFLLFRYCRLFPLNIGLEPGNKFLRLNTSEPGYSISYKIACAPSLKSQISDRLITKTYLYNFDPLKPHFIFVKLGFTGVYIIFLISAKKTYPVSILYKSIAGRYRPVRVADGPITARNRFIKNASWVDCGYP